MIYTLKFFIFNLTLQDDIDIILAGKVIRQGSVHESSSGVLLLFSYTLLFNSNCLTCFLCKFNKKKMYNEDSKLKSFCHTKLVFI